MQKQNYLLVYITKTSDQKKNNKIAIKFRNHANDNILFVDNVFQDGYQYVYQLWKCQLDVQEEIQIQILEVCQGKMNKLCKQSTLVQYSSEGEKFKFSDGKRMDFVFLFRVEPKIPLDEISQTEKLRQMNEQMNQYLKHCKQEIQSYQEFLNFTNHIIQELNQTTPKVEDEYKQRQKQKSTIMMKQNENQSRFQTQQQEIASNNASKTFSKRSQKHSSISVSEQKPKSPKLEDKIQSNMPSNTETINRSQLQMSQISSKNSRSFHKIDKGDAKISDLVDKAYGIESQSKATLSKYSYLDQKHSKRYKKITAFEDISEKSSEQDNLDQYKRKDRKRRVNQSEKYDKRNLRNNDKQRESSYIQNSQPSTTFNLDKNKSTTKKKENPASKLSEYIKSRRQQYKKNVSNEMKNIIKTKYSLQSTHKKSKTEPPYQQSSNIQQKKLDINSHQHQPQIQSERINIAHYNNSSQKHELEQEQIKQAPVLKRRKKQSLRLQKQSLVGTNHKIQLLYNNPKTSSIRDNSNNPPFETHRLLTLKITSIKITTYTSSKIAPKRCMLTIGQHKYQTELKTSETNQIQWENLITIKPISYHSYIKATLISLLVNKQKQQGDVKISVEDLTKNKKKMFKTHLNSQTLAIGFLQLKYTFQQYNRPHFPEKKFFQLRQIPTTNLLQLPKTQIDTIHILIQNTNTSKNAMIFTFHFYSIIIVQKVQKAKMLNNYVKQTQHFIIELIQVYQLITKQLQKLSQFKDNHHSQWIENITQKIVACNCIDRSIRRENQLRLFRDTLRLVQKYVAKKDQVKKHDIAMKYSFVCEVLANRLRELLKIPIELKSNILTYIEISKQKFLQWAENKKKNRPKQQNTIKQTDRYILKFMLTDTSTTANASHYVSSVNTPLKKSTTATPEIMRTVRKFLEKEKAEKQKYEKQNEKQNKQVDRTSLKKFSYLHRSKKDELQISKPQRKTEPIRKSTHKSIQNTQRQLHKTVTFIQPQPEPQKPVEKSSLQMIDDDENIEIKPIKTKKLCTIDRMFMNSDDEEDKYNQQIQQKKSQFYLSQNYIRSKKTIETGSILAKQMKKKSLGMDLSHKFLSQMNEISEDSCYQDMDIDNSRFMRQKKTYFTRKYIPHQKSTKQIHKSLKFVSNSNTDEVTTMIKEKRNTNKPRTKNQRNSTTNKGLKRKDKQQQEGDVVNPIYFKQNNSQSGTDNLMEGKVTSKRFVKKDFSKKDASLLGDYYSQLINMRKNIQQQSEESLKDYSVFFRQQQKISDEQSRKVQKVLNERLKASLSQQFPIKSQITKKSIKKYENYHENSYIQGVRQHMMECSGLVQSGLQQINE